MPLSHIALTVSDLPSSVSFYLSALHPLSYRFLGQWGSSVGLGPSDSTSADLFLTQESPESGLKVGTSHIALCAPSRSAVRAFYTAALGTGATEGEPPAYRNEGSECFNAVVLDLDGNSVEVVYHDGLARGGGSVARSNLLEWKEDGSRAVGSSAVEKSERGSKSLDKWKAVGSAALDALAATPSGVSRSRPESLRRGSSSAVSRRDSGSGIPGLVRSFTDPLLREAKRVDMSEKALIGTVLGAAAGAAVAYAMCKSEEESARAEREYNRLMAERRRPRIEMVDYEALDRSGGRRRRSLPAIEAPPMVPLPSNYEPPSYESVIREGSRAKRDDERSRVSMARSATWPAELPGNEYYDRPKESKSRSGGSRSSRSIRDGRSERLDKPPSLPSPQEKHYVEGLEDSKTVVPSDSVSCAGSRGRRSRSYSKSAYKRRSDKLEKIEERSESTITPRKYYERSGRSLPLRGRERDWRRGVASYAG